MQDFKEREAQVAEAEQLAASYSDREANLASREESVTALEDRAQKANAAAEYARREADAMWNKQKVGLCAISFTCHAGVVFDVCTSLVQRYWLDSFTLNSNCLSLNCSPRMLPRTACLRTVYQHADLRHAVR